MTEHYIKGKGKSPEEIISEKTAMLDGMVPGQDYMKFGPILTTNGPFYDVYLLRYPHMVRLERYEAIMFGGNLYCFHVVTLQDSY